MLKLLSFLVASVPAIVSLIDSIQSIITLAGFATDVGARVRGWALRGALVVVSWQRNMTLTALFIGHNIAHPV